MRPILLSGANKCDYVTCPVCGEPDMRKETDDHGNSLILCVNHACLSNGSTATLLTDELAEIRRVIGDRYPDARMLETIHALRAALRTYGVHTTRCLEGRMAEAKAVLEGTGTISKCNCGLDELHGTAGEVTLETVSERYRTAKVELLQRNRLAFPLSSVVAVACPQYTGPGIVTMEDGCPPDKVPVRLENGNVWWYPVEACKRVVLTDSKP